MIDNSKTEQYGPSDVGRFVICCADRPGIISTVATFLHHEGANIIDFDQHSSGAPEGKFFLRLEFQLKGLVEREKVFSEAFAEKVAAAHDMQWTLTLAVDKPRTAIFVSKFDHALMELLWRVSRDLLPIEVSLVISNHDDLRQQVEGLGFRFKHIPVNASNKAEAEQETINLLNGEVDLLVLARYMQILSDEQAAHFAGRCINIHHSFLPGFKGAKPYHQAYERGVKMIGASAHYVTADLDEGPIIHQDVEPISHADTPDQLVRKGRDIESRVLAEAVRLHLEDRVLLNGQRTVVFRS